MECSSTRNSYDMEGRRCKAGNAFRMNLSYTRVCVCVNVHVSFVQVDRSTEERVYRICRKQSAVFSNSRKRNRPAAGRALPRTPRTLPLLLSTTTARVQGWDRKNEQEDEKPRCRAFFPASRQT